MDFNPRGAVAPTPKGKKYRMPDVEVETLGSPLTFGSALWLQMFFNGYERTPSETDAVILSKSFVQDIREQEDVKLQVINSQVRMNGNAAKMLGQLKCGQSGTFSTRGGPVVVMGDADSFSIHLGIGSFSVYWDAVCDTGPKKCCVKNSDCESGFGNETPFSCKINWTAYDTYNFSWRSGTGGSGWLKRINPLGWYGTSFSSFGYWKEAYSGAAKECLPQEKIASLCCEPPKTETFTPPPPPPQPPAQPPHAGGGAAESCPECEAIAKDIGLARSGIAEAVERITNSQKSLEENLKRQKAINKKITALQNEADKGQWTASGTDSETGRTADYDATQGDGQVHVTVRDANGEVIASYTYPRSKSATETQEQLDDMQKRLKDLQDEETRLNTGIKIAQSRKAGLEADLQRLEAALEECLKRCHGVVLIEQVHNLVGNNPFAPQNPLGGGQVTTPGCTGSPPVSESQTQACPSGQTGSIIQNRSYSCVNGAWAPGSWTTTSSTCTTTTTGCTGSPPVSESQTQACPSAQTGSIIQNRSYSCVNGAWAPGAWQTVSNSCTCNPAVQPQPDGQNLACPAGQTGTITQQRAYVCSNGSWIPGTNWIEVTRNCTTPLIGCATNYSSGNYVCSGSCGIGSTGLTVTPGGNTMTANPLGSNSNVLINCSGATASPQSTNLIILGLPGHTCTFTGSSLTSFGIACRNNSGGTCSSSCSR